MHTVWMLQHRVFLLIVSELEEDYTLGEDN